MHDSPDEAVLEVSAAADSPPDTNVLEIRAQAADAILGPVPTNEAEGGSTGRILPNFRRVLPHVKSLLGYGPPMALVACLVGFAWVAGSYFSSDQSPRYAIEPQPAQSVVLQESGERAEMLRSLQKMSEEIRALKTNVEAMQGTRSQSTKDATGASTAELADKIGHLQREFAAKLSQVSERFDRIEHQIVAPRSPASVASASAPGAATPRKRTHGARGDAFDPSQNPNAPGAPRPLGSLAPAASANPTGENASGHRAN
jgi:hypothetical protein